MYRIHKTKSGEAMFVGQMTNPHLINTIKFLCRQAYEARSFLESPAAQSPDPVLMAMGGGSIQEFLSYYRRTCQRTPL